MLADERAKQAPLRGEAKLAAALDRFGIDPAGRIALDAGAAAGGFTKVLLERGARRVYAVDAGHGQLLGSLRQDARVVNLEGVNLGALDNAKVPDEIELITLDLSYLSLTVAVPQLARIRVHDRADLIALVKPMFELALPEPPRAEDEIQRALDLAVTGVERAGWRVKATLPSPVTGARGAREHLLYAARIRP